MVLGVQIFKQRKLLAKTNAITFSLRGVTSLEWVKTLATFIHGIRLLLEFPELWVQIIYSIGCYAV